MLYQTLYEGVEISWLYEVLNNLSVGQDAKKPVEKTVMFCY